MSATYDMKVSSKCLVSLPQEEDQSSSFFVASTRSLRSLNEVRIVRSTPQLFLL